MPVTKKDSSKPKLKPWFGFGECELSFGAVLLLYHAGHVLLVMPAVIVL